MAISSATCRNSYTGNGVTTAFAYTFKITNQSYIKVITRLIASPYTESVKTIITDYTVSGVGVSTGGNVTFLSAPSSAYTVELLLDEPVTQPTSIRNQGTYYPSTHEDAFDHLARVNMCQQDQLDRSIRQPESEAPVDMELPSTAERASKFLAFDADGLPIASSGTTDGSVPVSAFMETVLDDTTAGAARTTLDAQQATNSLTAETAPAVGDLFPMYDVSATADRKITLANVFKILDAFTEDTAPAFGDELLTYDISTSTAKKILLAALTREPVVNLGCSLAAGVFTMHGEDGTALSATNPAWVNIPSRTHGLHKRIKVTANQSFNDDAHASSDMVGNLFGTTASVAWASAKPFYLYACLNDSENAVVFAVSPLPHLTTVPATSALGKTGSAAADAEISMYLMGNPTVGDYDGNPCVCIGSIQMTKTTSDDWTVAALTETDGIGRFNERTIFAMVVGQKGAAAGKFFGDNGGTAPHFSSSTYNYMVSRDGKCRCWYGHNQTSFTSGAGAVSMVMPNPFTSAISAETQLGGGSIQPNSYNDYCSVHVGSSTSVVFYRPINNAYAQNGAWTTGTNTKLYVGWEFPINR